MNAFDAAERLAPVPSSPERAGRFAWRVVAGLVAAAALYLCGVLLGVLPWSPKIGLTAVVIISVVVGLGLAGLSYVVRSTQVKLRLLSGSMVAGGSALAASPYVLPGVDGGPGGGFSGEDWAVWIAAAILLTITGCLLLLAIRRGAPDGSARTTPTE